MPLVCFREKRKKNMDKKELIEAVAFRTDSSFDCVKDIMNAMLGVIGDTMRDSGEIVLSDFGRFHIKNIPARKMVNPETGEALILPKHDKIAFKAYRNITRYSEKYEYRKV